MSPAEYHGILLALTEAERRFEAGQANWTPEDREIYQLLRLVRAEVLKRESGHPFPSASFAAAKQRLGSVVGTPPLPATPESKKVRVLVVDDEEGVRTVVRLLLSSAPDLQVVGEAANGQQALDLAVAVRPDVVLMDFNMPVLNGIDATRAILRVLPATKVILFTANRATSSAEHAASAGAVGVLFKPATKAQMLSIVRAASAGGANLGEMQPGSTKSLP